MVPYAAIGTVTFTKYRPKIGLYARCKKKEREAEVDIGREAIARDPYFGTAIIRTNLPGSADEIYRTYKMRDAIEQCFDTLKNTLEQDHSKIQKVKIGQVWKTAEYTKKTQKICESLGFSID
jgi:hypothetical protein